MNSNRRPRLFSRSQKPDEERSPASDFDPVSAKLLALYPLTNLSGKNNFFSNQTEKIAQDQYLGRLDHASATKTRMFYRPRCRRPPMTSA